MVKLILYSEIHQSPTVILHVVGNNTRGLTSHTYIEIKSLCLDGIYRNSCTDVYIISDLSLKF